MNKLIGLNYALEATNKVSNLKYEPTDALQQLESIY